MVHPADASGGPCKDDVPRKKSHDLREVADEEGDSEDKVLGVGLLHGLAIDPTFDCQV
jgi:hypothetical protein